MSVTLACWDTRGRHKHTSDSHMHKHKADLHAWHPAWSPVQERDAAGRAQPEGRTATGKDRQLRGYLPLQAVQQSVNFAADTTPDAEVSRPLCVLVRAGA